MDFFNSEIQHELTLVVANSEKYIESKPITDAEWERILGNMEIDPNYTLSQRVSITPPEKWPYKWIQSEDEINVFVYNADISSIQIDENGISSPTLSGRWWAPITQPTMIANSGTVMITLFSKVHFPVLIRGGENIDPYSQFLLGMLSIHHGDSDVYLNLLYMSALRGEQNSQHYLGKHLIPLQNYNESVHWLSRAALEHQDKHATISLASLLLSHETELTNVLVAEKLYLWLCEYDVPEAFLRLGKIYLEGIPEIPQNVQRGLELLEYAANELHVPQAIKYYGEYLAEHENDEISVTDILVSLGLLGLASFALFSILRRRFR